MLELLNNIGGIQILNEITSNGKPVGLFCSASSAIRLTTILPKLTGYKVQHYSNHFKIYFK